MNISDLTIERLKNRGQKKMQEIKHEDSSPLPEPVSDVKDFFKESMEKGGGVLLTSNERYANFLLENNIIDESFSPEIYEIYGTVALSDLFRSVKHKLNEEQASAFSGIENVRAYLDAANCNCPSKKAQLEQYYRDFVLANSTSDLFTAMKKDSPVKKIIFYHENQIILEA